MYFYRFKGKLILVIDLVEKDFEKIPSCPCCEKIKITSLRSKQSRSDVLPPFSAPDFFRIKGAEIKQRYADLQRQNLSDEEVNILWSRACKSYSKKMDILIKKAKYEKIKRMETRRMKRNENNLAISIVE